MNGSERFCTNGSTVRDELRLALAAAISLASRQSTLSLLELANRAVPEITSFHENKPKMLVLYDWKQAFWACFHENWVYKFGHSGVDVNNSEQSIQNLFLSFKGPLG
jgi:hypothetical protein